ncbi:mfs transporter [Diplodia corticola]|uniref:Mfs transporter n=1 Tax=Diplodia corticola TaxID=236234 RepID=A0A1J9S758_9PEZI|nr:mfs transporter [Diplodia corticola]OJD35437.1 mfs transporter [Diplodia corticola]
MYAFTASRWQVATYLFGVALFSISFLVFLNSTLSFVITDRIGRKHGVGDAVGTLGFADELVALVGCPLWGMVSDRVGVAKVAVVGYAIVALSLFLFVQASNVYPQLLLGRLLFALGASATTTMVTAVLPAMTHVLDRPSDADPASPSRDPDGNNIAPSISSELTITPARLNPASSHPSIRSTPGNSAASTSNLAGLVGMFTGLGALLALGVFLPLPARFQKSGVAPSEAVEYSFYVVGSVAFVVAFACMIGLRHLPGEEDKSWRGLFTVKQKDDSTSAPILPYPRLLLESLTLGLSDANIGLGYLGGFVARASSVAISLFIPLFANAYFIEHGDCKPGDGKTSDDVKRNCRRAYLVASALTGTSQLIALLCAPVFGYLAGRYKRYHQPLILATLSGVAGYIALGLLKSPDPQSEDGSAGVFFIVALLGISQIGAIVCSLGLLGRGIQGDEEDLDDDAATDENERPSGGFDISTHIQGAPPSGFRHAAHHLDPDVTPVPSPNVASPRDPLLGGGGTSATSTPPRRHLGTRNSSGGSSSNNSNGAPSGGGHGYYSESSPLLPSHFRRLPPSRNRSSNRAHLKGSIAGVYSLAGGAGILILTKLGGLMFDRIDPGAPFFVMAAFNVILLAAVVASATRRVVKGWRTRIVMP